MAPQRGWPPERGWRCPQPWGGRLASLFPGVQRLGGKDQAAVSFGRGEGRRPPRAQISRSGCATPAGCVARGEVAWTHVSEALHVRPSEFPGLPHGS